MASFLHCSLHSHAHTTYWLLERSITTISIRFICTNKCAMLILDDARVFTEWMPSHAIDSYYRSRNYNYLPKINLYCCIVSWLLITLYSLLQPFLSTLAAHKFAIPIHLFTLFSCIQMSVAIFVVFSWHKIVENFLIIQFFRTIVLGKSNAMTSKIRIFSRLTFKKSSRIVKLHRNRNSTLCCK